MNSQKRKIFVRNENRAIKQVFQLRGVVLILTLTIVLLFGRIVLGATILEDDFETYNLGDLVGQGNWELREGSSSTLEVVNVFSKSGVKSIRGNLTSSSHIANKVGNALTEGQIGFWFWVNCDNGGSTSGQNLRFMLLSPTDQIVDIFIQPINTTCSIDALFQLFIFENGVPFYSINDTLEQGVWHSLEMEWGSDKVRYRVNNELWTNWKNPAHASSFSVLEEVYLIKQNFGSKEATFTAYFDYISEFAIGYSGECGFANFLRYCYNQSECESFGGYWVADFCWETEPPPITNFTTYYTTHSRFATPTSLILSLVNLTSPVLETAGGWIVAFEDIFDVVEAGDRGTQFGEAIPKARGYLASINEIFGGFPISESFIFFLIITIGVVIFRIIRNIIALIKII